MNPRIKELAEQSGLKVESWMTNPPKPFQILGSTEQFEKFAELIVRECAELNFRELGLSGSSSFDVGRMIKQHFGVEN